MLALILLAATILRLIALNQSLWLDEAININVVRGLDFKALIFNYSLSDFHPPLYHVILKSWDLVVENLLHLPPYEFIFRLPSVIFGVLTVYLVYLIGKKLYDKKTAIIATTLLATAPLHIYYSQEARMYMLACFLAAASAYFFISLISRDKLIYWIGFIVSSALMLYSDYLPYLMIPTYLLYLIFNFKKIPKNTLKAFVPALFLISALVTPWLLLLPKQLRTGLSAAAASPAWAQVVGSPDFKSLSLTFVKFIIGRISMENDTYYILAFLPVGLFVGALLLMSFLRNNYKRSFIYFWFIAPIILSFSLAFFIPIYAYFRLIFVLPALYLILASAINVVNFKPLVRTLLALMLLINLVCTTFYFVYPQFQRENWQKASKYVLDASGRDTVVLFESNYTMAPFDFYNQNQVDAYGALDSFDASTSDIYKKLTAQTKNKKKAYLFQYLSGITDPQGLVFRNLSTLGFVNTKTTDFEGVGFVYEFKHK